MPDRAPTAEDFEAECARVLARIGVPRDAQDLQNLIQRFRGPVAARQTLEGVWNYWNRTLGAVYIDTPDPAVNALANGWLVYQVLSSRMWACTGFYQSGGAYGFRDQLQDSCALIYSEPKLIREHLLGVRRISSAPAMCSIGGIRRSGAGCGRIFQMITFGCRMWHVGM